MGAKKCISTINPTQLTNQLAQSAPPDLVQEVLSIPVPRKVDNEGFALDFVNLNKPPKTAVLAVVTVVSHNK